MRLEKLLLAGMLCAGMISTASAAELKVTMNEATTSGAGKAMGQVTISETPFGLLFTPDLKGLEPGVHGFHVHENASCDAAEKDGKTVPAQAAGGHLDPKKTGKHEGPYSEQGHLGDLPGLVVAADGTSTYPVLAPRIKALSDVQQHALMIHEGGDNYSDHPKPLGGGGGRMVCGVIK